LFPWLPFVKNPGFERLGNRGGHDARRKTSSSDIAVRIDTNQKRPVNREAAVWREDRISED
jgi:hypothetical protein